MIRVKFYLDKGDKNDMFPIHLVIRQKQIQIKVATGEKIEKNDWDNKTQLVKNSCAEHEKINKFLLFLKNEIEEYIKNAPHTLLTTEKIKVKILSLVNGRKNNTQVKMIKNEDLYYKNKEKITFLDLFAGAGGFSEGFLQAEYQNKIFDFLLASDINENCELTHLARYNYQLGLDVSFLRQDICEIDFLENLLEKLDGKNIDVVCGGPPCQSFSLAGKRKKFDKKDDLFAQYLKVIRQLRPKYFIMENVKGILTKEGGKVKEMILREIRSIVDLKEFYKLLNFVDKLKEVQESDTFILDSYLNRLKFETAVENDLETQKERYISNIEKKFKNLTPKIVSYKISKTNPAINTIRHGFNLLKRSSHLEYVKKKVIEEKAIADLDNDSFFSDFDNFLSSIETEAIIQKITKAFEALSITNEYVKDVNEIVKSLRIYSYTFDECINGLKTLSKDCALDVELENILAEIRLYNIEKPFVAMASNYGVPQNRERVLFIGCRKDQPLVSDIPPNIQNDDKVTVFEALYDLDFVENDDEKFDYEAVNLKAKYNGSTKKMTSLLKKRNIDSVQDSNGDTYANWSKKGRLNSRFPNSKKAFYIKNFEELNNKVHLVAPLHNHKTSKQNKVVIERLKTILDEGGYESAKEKLKSMGLNSEKRNYNVLNPYSQSPTVLTIPDDYIHYSYPRALTVREMARLQSFDDSFVFQGKRSTGGSKRKSEIPQYTLVGNAIPPLLAKAIGQEILKHIIKS